MGLMLETSVLIAAERGRFDLPALLMAHPGEPLGLAAITLSELRHGCLRANSPVIRQRRERFVMDVVSRSSVIAFGSSEAEHHAAIWVDLETKGQMIGPHDLLIAACARSIGYALATLNQAEFARVPGLTLLAVAAYLRSV
jgi:predicted nucleic acid-binding protein